MNEREIKEYLYEGLKEFIGQPNYSVVRTGIRQKIVDLLTDKYPEADKEYYIDLFVDNILVQ